jgi:hypothetical protein
MTAGIAELSALLAEVDRAIAALEQHASDIARHRPAGVPDPPDESELAFIGVQMSAWYNALEDLFSRVARAFGESPAAGDAWHTELLRRMAAPAPHVRPALVAPALYAALLTVLKFRHFLRHAYAVRLDWTKMAPAVEALTGSHPQVLQSLRQFRAAVEAVVLATDS